MLKIKKLLRDKFIIFLCLLIILIGTIGASFFMPENNMPTARHGVLDARGWNFNKNGVLQLNGEWEFYPDQLLSPTDISKETVLSNFTQIPNASPNWKGTEKSGGWGYATYRLKILLNPGETTLGLKVNSVQTSNEVFLDGKSVIQTGKPGYSRKDYIPANHPKEIFFSTNKSEVEIVIQVANYDYYTTGIVSPILLGNSEHLLKTNFIQNGLEISTTLAIAIFGLYYLFLFASRAGDKSLIIFGVFFVLFAVQTLFEGEKNIFQFLPMLPHYVFWKCRIILMDMALPFIALNTWTMLSPWKYRHVLLPPVVLLLCHAIAVFFLPMYMVGQAACMYLLMGALAFCAVEVFITLIAAYFTENYCKFEKNEMHTYILATFVMVIIVANTILFVNAVVMTTLITSLSKIVFTLLITLMLAQRSANNVHHMGRLVTKLEIADKQKDDFLFRTSHELKTPINGIVNILQSVKEKAEQEKRELSPSSAHSIYLIQTLANRMSGMVNDIMDMARIKEGRLRVEIAPVDLKACAIFIVELFSFQANGKRVGLNFAISDDARYVIADENRLIQVLTNLVDNGIKFTDRGTVTISSYRKKGMIYIAIEDSGRGIPKSKIGDIFKPYEQEDERDIGRSGIGLGLSISEQLVKVMGGQLYLEWSEEGKGSRFVFTLPTNESGQSEGSSINLVEKMEGLTNSYTPDFLNRSDIEKRHVQNHIDKVNVLVVDDEVINLEILSGLFPSNEYNLVTAMSGQEALQKITENKPEIVLLDVMLPDLTGYEVCRLIRKNNSLIDLPVLFITVRNTPEDVELALAAGGNDFITKPFNARELRARVLTLLTMKKMTFEVLKNEMAFLQAQIKPHFLYNAINTISAFSLDDAAMTRELLAKLSHFLRGSFDFNNRNKLITLRKELDLVEAYLFIEKARFGDRLQVVYQIDEDVECLLPPLIIQPLVENAVIHGISELKKGGTVQIIVRNEADQVWICVEDNGRGIDETILPYLLYENNESIGGVALKNIQRRLLSLYGHGIELENKPEGGTKAVIRIAK